MIRKRDVIVVSTLAVVSLISVGFSAFYIVPKADMSINVNTGSVLDFNELVSNKEVEYGIGKNGFLVRATNNNEEYEYITKNEAEITLSFQLDTYEIQEVLDSFTSSFTFYIELYESGSGILSEPSIISYRIFYTYIVGNSTFSQPFINSGASITPNDDSLSDNLLLTCTLEGLSESDTNSSSLDVSLTILLNDISDDDFDANLELLQGDGYFYFYVGADI